MDDNEIKNKLNEVINIFLKNEQWLLIHNLSEQSMTHKLAEYLQIIFNEYNVDCEYNGNVHRDGGRKRLEFIKEELVKAQTLRQNELTLLEAASIQRAVFPDIIVHIRGTNSENLLVIEVKKSTSDIRKETYDYLKLKSFTSHEDGNDLRFQLGAFIKFVTGEDYIGYELTYFKEGQVEQN